MLRESWLVLDPFLDLQQYTRFPVIQPADLIIFVDNPGEHFPISTLYRVYKCLGKLGLTSGGEGHILCRVLVQTPLSGYYILIAVDKTCYIAEWTHLRARTPLAKEHKIDFNQYSLTLYFVSADESEASATRSYRATAC